MLRIKKVISLPAPAGSLVIDDYIPFRFRLADEALPSPYVWRTGNFTTSLLEVVIDHESRVIFGVTLTSFSGAITIGLPEQYQRAMVVKGVPVADISSILQQSRDEPGRTFDETNELKIFRNQNEVIVVLGDGAPSQCIRTDRVGFFDSASQLCGVGFFDLSQSEIGAAISLLER